jgi:hypothetical protein
MRADECCPCRSCVPAGSREERWGHEGQALLDHVVGKQLAHAIPEVGLVEGPSQSQERGIFRLWVTGAACTLFGDSLLSVVEGAADADVLADDGASDERW